MTSDAPVRLPSGEILSGGSARRWRERRAERDEVNVRAEENLRRLLRGERTGLIDGGRAELYSAKRLSTVAQTRAASAVADHPDVAPSVLRSMALRDDVLGANLMLALTRNMRASVGVRLTMSVRLEMLEMGETVPAGLAREHAVLARLVTELWGSTARGDLVDLLDRVGSMDEAEVEIATVLARDALKGRDPRRWVGDQARARLVLKMGSAL